MCRYPASLVCATPTTGNLPRQFLRCVSVTDDSGDQPTPDEGQPAQPWLGSDDHLEWQARNHEAIAAEVERIGERLASWPNEVATTGWCGLRAISWSRTDR